MDKSSRSNLLCKQCGNPFRGRPDKKYCSVKCKNLYNHQRRARTRSQVERIDAFLHRNREILEELMEGRGNKLIIDRRKLDRMGFRYSYLTGFYYNKEGKMYRNVYDYAYMEFSDQKILIVRRRVNQVGGQKFSSISG